MARPRKDQAKGYDAMLVTRLPAELKERIQAAAERQGVPVSEWVVSLLERHIEAQAKPK